MFADSENIGAPASGAGERSGSPAPGGNLRVELPREEEVWWSSEQLPAAVADGGKQRWWSAA